VTFDLQVTWPVLVPEDISINFRFSANPFIELNPAPVDRIDAIKVRDYGYALNYSKPQASGLSQSANLLNLQLQTGILCCHKSNCLCGHCIHKQFVVKGLGATCERLDNVGLEFGTGPMGPADDFQGSPNVSPEAWMDSVS
jgi:hypothetical protein